MCRVEIGQTYRKKAPPLSGRLNPENRGVHSVVRVIRIDDEGVASLRLVSGPLLFTSRMHVNILRRNFDLMCICARCAKYDGCPNTAPLDEDNIPGYEGICADCREDRCHAGYTPEVK